jgi:glutathione synthase/RimK-type ligase-like ATP-grasp enzyme
LILLCGLMSETPLERVREALDALGADHCTLDPRRAGTSSLEPSVAGGRLRADGHDLPLDAVRGVYNRWSDPASLPDVARRLADRPERGSSHRLHQTLMHWMEVTPARVVNRCSAMGSNSSKPYQAQAIRRAGFEIPETLITNRPDEALRFFEERGEVIYKSISGVRSIVHTLERADLPRLDRIRACPVQFQEKVPGDDVRVHVVADRLFATRIETRATDYRYAGRQVGEAARLEPFELPDDVAERCVAVTAALGLEVAGVDLKRTPDGRYYCFEVNPSPAFSFYQDQTGQPIAHAIAQHLLAA